MDGTDLASALKWCLASGTRADWERFIALAQPVIAAGVLRCVARFATPSRELADDLIQETFLKLCAGNYRVLRNFRNDEQNSLQVYLKTIAGSTVLDHYRSQLSKTRGSGKVTVSLDEIAERVAGEGSHAADLERQMSLELIEKCLEAHELRNRTIFRLYHLQELKPKTICALPGIGMSQSGVETVVYRLTIEVRECVKRREGVAT